MNHLILIYFHCLYILIKQKCKEIDTYCLFFFYNYICILYINKYILCNIVYQINVFMDVLSTHLN